MKTKSLVSQLAAIRVEQVVPDQLLMSCMC